MMICLLVPLRIHHYTIPTVEVCHKYHKRMHMSLSSSSSSYLSDPSLATT